MKIRQETAADRTAVYHLVQTAFAGAAHADGTEQDLVEALRESSTLSRRFRWLPSKMGRL